MSSVVRRTLLCNTCRSYLLPPPQRCSYRAKHSKLNLWMINLKYRNYHLHYHQNCFVCITINSSVSWFVVSNPQKLKISLLMKHFQPSRTILNDILSYSLVCHLIQISVVYFLKFWILCPKVDEYQRCIWCTHRWTETNHPRWRREGERECPNRLKEWQRQ